MADKRTQPACLLRQSSCRHLPVELAMCLNTCRTVVMSCVRKAFAEVFGKSGEAQHSCPLCGAVVVGAHDLGSPE